MRDDNPIPGPSPENYDEAYFTEEQADALYDAYAMLLDLGFTEEATRGIVTVINQTTIYDAEDVEKLSEVA